MKRAPAADAFVACGFRARHWFAHEVACAQKAYPDTLLQLERRGCPPEDLRDGRPLQLNLYATDLSGLPDALFTDRAVNWHGQQLGRRGHVASAALFRTADSLRVVLLQSDVCQQVSRHPALKAAARTRIDNRWGHWYELLTNAVLDLARDQGLAMVRVPTAELVLANIRKRVDPALFQRIYDWPERHFACRRIDRGAGEHWEIPVAANESRVAALSALPAPDPRPRRAVVLFHDVEEDVDTAIEVDGCQAGLERTLELERARGVRATYNVLGNRFEAKAEAIARGGHALGFHSYDHRVEALDQLPRVRGVDLQVRGYRPPKSILTAELTDRALSFYNFDWLLCSARRLSFDVPRLENGIAKLPVHLDDWPLQSGRMEARAWRAEVSSLLVRRHYVAIGLHDCYARHWLPWYDELLDELTAAGELVTADELADRLFLASAWAPALEPA